MQKTINALAGIAIVAGLAGLVITTSTIVPHNHNPSTPIAYTWRCVDGAQYPPLPFEATFDGIREVIFTRDDNTSCVAYR